MKKFALVIVILAVLSLSVTAADSDRDGIPDEQDKYPYDYDNDGIPDAWERKNGLRFDKVDSDKDYDFDGLTNLDEYLHKTDPWSRDTDGDGLSDKQEEDTGTDPTDPNDPPKFRAGSLMKYVYLLVLLILIVLIFVFRDKLMQSLKAMFPKKKPIVVKKAPPQKTVEEKEVMPEEIPIEEIPEEIVPEKPAEKPKQTVKSKPAPVYTPKAVEKITKPAAKLFTRLPKRRLTTEEERFEAVEKEKAMKRVDLLKKTFGEHMIKKPKALKKFEKKELKKPGFRRKLVEKMGIVKPKQVKKEEMIKKGYVPVGEMVKKKQSRTFEKLREVKQKSETRKPFDRIEKVRKKVEEEKKGKFRKIPKGGKLKDFIKKRAEKRKEKFEKLPKKTKK